MTRRTFLQMISGVAAAAAALGLHPGGDSAGPAGTPPAASGGTAAARPGSATPDELRFVEARQMLADQARAGWRPPPPHECGFTREIPVSRELLADAEACEPLMRRALGLPPRLVVASDRGGRIVRRVAL